MAKIINELQDLTHLKWTKARNSSGTAGSFLKSQEIINGEKIYYKLSNYDSVKGIIGHECINEIIADRILTSLNIDHVKYTLIHAKVLVERKEHVTYLCASKDFKTPGENKIALDVFYQMNANDNETPLEFCIRMGWSEYVFEMLLIDYLILNRDRHGANIEVLRNSKKKSIRIAPLFDHGLSFLFSAYNNELIAGYDITKQRQIQCFVGSNCAEDNLRIIPKSHLKQLPIWTNEFEKELFNGLDEIIDSVLLIKIKQMLKNRWEYYEDFCNKE